MFTLLNGLDRACDVLPTAARLGLYGLISGVVAMLVYWQTSPQSRILLLRQQISEAQRTLRAYTGTDVRVILKLSAETISPAFRQLLLVLGPSLVALLPVLLAVMWLESTHSHRLPGAGDLVAATISGASGSADATARWLPSAAVKEQPSGGRCIIRWPARDQMVTLVDATSGKELLRLPLQRPVHTVGRPRWWSPLLEGRDRVELPADARISSIDFDLPTRWVWSIGPQWMRTWHTPFMTALTVAVLVMKFTIKIV